MCANVLKLEIQTKKKKHFLKHSPARRARIQSIRSFSLATVKYNVYCGIDRPGS